MLIFINLNFSLLSGFLLYLLYKSFIKEEEKEKKAFLFEGLLENQPFAMLISDEKGNIIKANTSTIMFYGYTKEELSSLKLKDIFLDDSYKKLLESKESTLVATNKTKTGLLKIVEVYASSFSLENKKTFLILISDITEKIVYQKLLEGLREINETITRVKSLNALFENICNTLLKFGIDGVIIYDIKNHEIREFFSKGDIESIKDLRIELNDEDNVIVRALKTKDIAILSACEENISKASSFNKKLYEERFYSKAAIPVFKDDKLVYIIALFKKEYAYFNQNVKIILEELKRDLSFAISKIEELERLYLFDIFIQKSEELFGVIDENFNIYYLNEKIKKLFNLNEEPLKLEYFFKEKELNEIIKALKEKGYYENTSMFKVKEEELIINFNITKVELKDEYDRKIRYIILGKDLTMERELYRKLQEANLKDNITKLFNIDGLSFEINSIIKELYLKGVHKTGIFITLDIINFGNINRYYGFDVGNLVLRELGNRINVFYENYKNKLYEFVAGRTGADEFGIFILPEKDISYLDNLTELSNYLSRKLELNYKEEKITIEKLSFNAGIALFPYDGDEFSELYNKSSTAKKKAQEEGVSVEFFSSNMKVQIENMIEAEKIIIKALKKELFKFYYQPYFSSKDNSVLGFEALIRIIDEDGNLISPYKFINYLENSPYLKEFENLSLKLIEEDIKDFEDKIRASNLSKDFSISLNISPNSFKNELFISKLLGKLEKLGPKITIEIVERTFLENIEESIELLNKIKLFGSKIAIDDFGTGYSSLNYIKNIPIDILKIDISFIRDMLYNQKSLAIVKTIITLSKELNIMTIAEGVETKEQFDKLVELGCDAVQGYYFAKPMTKEEAIKLLLV